MKETNQTFENRLQNFEERTKVNRKERDTLKDSLESSKSKIKNLEERILAEQKATAKAVFEFLNPKTDKRIDVTNSRMLSSIPFGMNFQKKRKS